MDNAGSGYETFVVGYDDGGTHKDIASLVVMVRKNQKLVCTNEIRGERATEIYNVLMSKGE